MNLVKKIMLFIIAIQVLVVLELMLMHYWKKRDSIVIKPSSLLTTTENRVQTSKIKSLPLTKERKAFAMTITKSIKEKIENLSLLIKKGELLAVNEFDNRKKIEEQAKKFLGIPYVWGATGPNRFDCSGFTQKIFKTAGIELPRHSTRQAMVGEYIRYEDLQLGDMVFFDTSKRHRGFVNHVGIYLEDGKFIHASSGKKRVVITSFNKKRFYKRRFLWGRRVINSVKNVNLEHFSINNRVKAFLLSKKI